MAGCSESRALETESWADDTAVDDGDERVFRGRNAQLGGIDRSLFCVGYWCAAKLNPLGLQTWLSVEFLADLAGRLADLDGCLK